MRPITWIFASLLLLLAACSRGATPPVLDTESAPIVVADALGRSVTLPAAPQRIVITGKALIMTADAAYTFSEAPERVVALGKTTQGANNFLALIDPNYAGKAIIKQDASAEQVAALQPDLVILKSYLAETMGQPIEALDIPVIYVDFETPEQYTRDLAILGVIFQDQARAEGVSAYYQERAEQIQVAVAGVNQPSVLLLYYTDRDGLVAFSVPPAGWMQTRLVEMAGGAPVWTEAAPAQGWIQVSLEQIAAWDAEHIAIIAYTRNPSEIVASLRSDPQWQALRAVQAGHLYAFPGDYYSWDQPDSRWILGLTWLAGRLHPECFPNQDMAREAQQFYERLYGLDPAFFAEHIRPTFQGDLP